MFIEKLTSNSIADTNSASLESLAGDAGLPEINDLDADPLLRLLDEEPEAWSCTVDKKFLKKLKDKEIKRQESIYELIITEKHHCLTLKIMQKVFSEGMIKELNLTKDMVERIFPCLEDLLKTHSTFLRRLRERQSQQAVIENVGDIILEQFQGTSGEELQSYYSKFCSHHKDAQSLYKDILKTDRKFQAFVKRYSEKPLCKARGIPECILLVTQRVTKYPLLIDSIIKASKDDMPDYVELKQSLNCIKDILNKIDATVAEREKDTRLLEIYNRIDAKSTAIFRERKFRKSDLFLNNRKLRYECQLSWKSARGKTIDVLAIILSDVVIFLQEGNQKYHFATMDNKSGVVPLQKLLVRQKAGQSYKGVYLILSNPNEPEMYEFILPTAKDQKAWIDEIRKAVDGCPEEEQQGNVVCSEFEGKKARFRELSSSLVQLSEEKMRILYEAMDLHGIENDGPDNAIYSHLNEENISNEGIQKAALEALRLSQSLYNSSVNLCRSVSSVGEHQSNNLVSPVLPKRAETFGGFDTPIKITVGEKPVSRKSIGQQTEPMLLQSSPSSSSPPTTPSEVSPNYSSACNTSALITNIITEDVIEEGVIRRDNSSSMIKNTDKDNSTTAYSDNLSLSEFDNRRYSGSFLEKTMQSKGAEKVHRRSFTDLISPSISLTNIANAANKTENTLAHRPANIVVSSPLPSPVAPFYQSPALTRLSTTPLLFSQGKEQLKTIVELQNQLNILICYLTYQQNLITSLKYQLNECDEQKSKSQRDLSTMFGKPERRSTYRPETQLEELRNIQEQLTAEKSQWQKRYENEKNDLRSKEEELEQVREQMKKEQEDLNNQRDLLYRKLEALQKEGIILSPSLTVVNIGSNNSNNTSDYEEQTKAISSSNQNSLMKQRNITSINVASPCSSLSSPPPAPPPPPQPIALLHTQSSLPVITSSPLVSTIISTNQTPTNSPATGSQQLPLHLSNNSKKTFGTSVNIKQQLPLKLATSVNNILSGNGNNSINGNGKNSSANYGNNSPTITFTVTQPEHPNSTSIILSNSSNQPTVNSNTNSQQSQKQQILPMKLVNESRCLTNSVTVSSPQNQPTESTAGSNVSSSTTSSSSSPSSTTTAESGVVDSNSLPQTPLTPPIVTSHSKSPAPDYHHHIRTGSDPVNIIHSNNNSSKVNHNINNNNNDQSSVKLETERRKSADEEIFC